MEHPLDDIYRDKIFKLKKLHSNMQMDQIDEERESMLFESSVLLRKSKQEANVINIDDEDPFLDNITEESGEF